MSAAVSQKNIDFIMKLQDDEDVKSEMHLNLASGKSLEKSIRHARASCARDSRWNGITPPRKSRAKMGGDEKTLAPSFIYLDHTKPGDDGDGSDFHEAIGAEDPAGLLDMRQSLSAVFTNSIEAGLDLIGQGTAQIALVIGLSQRRVQQIIVEQVESLNQHGSLMTVDQRVEKVLAAFQRPAIQYGNAASDTDGLWQQSDLLGEEEVA